MQKFLDVVGVTATLCALVSILLLAGSFFPDIGGWFGLAALVSMIVIGVSGTAEWLYRKGINDEYKKHFEKVIPQLPFKDRTPIKIEWKASKSLMMPARKIVSLSKESFDILPRQIFIMVYGSFETYLFQLFERSYPLISVTKDTLDLSLGILMKKRWDGKLSKMANTFGFEYKASQIKNYFSSLEMDFNGESITNPLDFLDKLVQVRHRIVHASSIFEEGRLITIDICFIPEFFFFLYHLTDYIDSLFAKRFGFQRIKINPAEA